MVRDDRARQTDDWGSDAPILPEPPAQRRRKTLLLIPALLLVLIEGGWIVAISVLIYHAVT